MFKFRIHQALATACFIQTLGGGVAIARTYPDDVDASPKAGENHPPFLSSPVAFYASRPGSDSSPTRLDSKVNVDTSYGNESWGGGYRYYQHVRAPSLKYQSVNFATNARARLFGRTYPGFSFSSATWNPRDNFRSSRLKIVVANKEIFNSEKSSTAPFSTTKVAFNKIPFDKTLFSMSKGYSIGGKGLRVKGAVKARVRLNVTAKAYRTSATRSGATLTGASHASLYGTVKGEADAWLASGSVTGSVDFVKLGATKMAKSERVGKSINYDTTLTANLCSLKGNIKGKVSTFWGSDYEKTLLRWNGYCFNQNIGGSKGTLDMGPRAYVFPDIYIQAATRDLQMASTAVLD